jgi:hypothetical protein
MGYAKRINEYALHEYREMVAGETYNLYANSWHLS